MEKLSTFVDDRSTKAAVLARVSLYQPGIKRPCTTETVITVNFLKDEQSNGKLPYFELIGVQLTGRLSAEKRRSSYDAVTEGAKPN